MNNKAQIKLIAFAVIALILLISLFLTVYTIPAGYRGVVLTFGKPSTIATGEGINFKIPFVQSVVKMDTRTTKYEAALTAASKDLQDVNTKIAINYHLSPDSVPEVYRTIGTNYADKLIYPLEQESNKAATAQFTAEELVTKREQVRTQMESILREKLAPRGIIIESVSILDFSFSPTFSQAIEAKVTAEQNALAAKNKLAQVEYEAKQRVTQAKGEADAIAIQAQAINAQGGKDYVQLQAISKWNGQLPQYMFGSGTTPFIDVTPKA
jgi:regulator of protease activity HflC (stomatin/prohibitin superfamily)